MDELDASAVRGKITLLPGHDAALTAVTFCIQDEDHTLGNALRYMLMKDIPHPSESKIHMRVQMNEHTVSAVDAFRDAIANLDQVFASIRERYDASLASGEVKKEPATASSVARRAEFSG
ncbi:RNA polymerase subunit AC19 [Malassezia brasiliensis]|uniref:RNA polymerase subunit AC19 n=1 Tax=Malassezia brasiliensis TaxID=1821822 RepID=A0AAF0DRF1_9BASI|nr:RNA polymerase subunit AC19 [Malassezia brasiliensis]